MNNPLMRSVRSNLSKYMIQHMRQREDNCKRGPWCPQLKPGLGVGCCEAGLGQSGLRAAPQHLTQLENKGKSALWSNPSLPNGCSFPPTSPRPSWPAEAFQNGSSIPQLLAIQLSPITKPRTNGHLPEPRTQARAHCQVGEGSKGTGGFQPTSEWIFEGGEDGEAGKGVGELCKVTLAEGFYPFPDDRFYVPLLRSQHRG